MISTIITALFSGIIGAVLGSLITVKLNRNLQIDLMKKAVAEDLFGYRY